MSPSRGLWQGLALALVVMAPPVLGQTVQLLQDARTLGADPNAPALGLQWRQAIRGTFSGALPLVGEHDEEGFLISFQPLVELHNEQGSLPSIPYRLWRGRFSFEGGYRRSARGPDGQPLGVWMVSTAMEHESDHFTMTSSRFSWPASSFLALNDFALRGGLGVGVGRHALTLFSTQRVLFLSCNQLTVQCRALRGSASFESLLEATFEWNGWTDRPTGFHPFASAAFSWLLPNGQLSQERRGVLHVGALHRSRRGGLFQAGAVGYLGNDVGMERENAVAHVGAFVRYGF